MDAVTLDMVLVLLILVVAIAMFVTEVVRIDVTALCVLVAVGGLGLVEPDDVLAGFSSNAVVAIIAVMILGEALDRVGVMARLASAMLVLGDSHERRMIGLLSATAAMLSGLIQNVGVAALFLPMTERIARTTGIAVSRLMMPMGFAALLGGSLTLVASGSMIVLNDVMLATAADQGLAIEPFGMLAPLPVGAALAIAGTVLFVGLGRRLLPVVEGGRDPRKAMADVAATYGLDQRIQAYLVPSESALRLRQISMTEADSKGVMVVALHTGDGEGLIVAPARDYVLRTGSVVGLVGPPEELQNFVAEYQLERAQSDPFSILHDPDHAGLAEVVVRPGSSVVGQTVGQMRLRSVFGVSLLAIHRHGRLIVEALRDVALEAGDVLVIFAPWQRIDHLVGETTLVPLSDYPTEPPRTAKLAWAIIGFALAMVLVLVTELQLAVALLVGVIIVLLSGTLSASEAYRAVSWRTVFLLAGLIPLGRAVEQSGAAAFAADWVIGATTGLPLWGIQLAIAALTTALSLTISNVGAAVLLIPLAMNVAVGVDADPAQFAMIVAIAASNSFVLPTHQVNALLMGPGGYKTSDYLRIGSWVTLIYLVVLVVTINLFW